MQRKIGTNNENFNLNDRDVMFALRGHFDPIFSINFDWKTKITLSPKIEIFALDRQQFLLMSDYFTKQICIVQSQMLF